MKSVEFMAWDKDRKLMCEVVAMDWYKDEIISAHLKDKSGNVEKVYPNERYGSLIDFLPFTGMYDTGNKKIFENYIVEGENYCGDKIRGYVKYIPPYFAVVVPSRHHYILQDEDITKVKILGDIYRHSHLLEGLI